MKIIIWSFYPDSGPLDRNDIVTVQLVDWIAQASVAPYLPILAQFSAPFRCHLG